MRKVIKTISNSKFKTCLDFNGSMLLSSVVKCACCLNIRSKPTLGTKVVVSTFIVSDGMVQLC